EVVLLRKVARQRGLAGAGGDATEGAEGLGSGEHDDLWDPLEHGANEVEEEGRVVEEVGEEAVALALGLDGETEALGEGDGCDAGHGVFEDGEEEGVGGGRAGVADAEALEDGAVGEHGGY